MLNAILICLILFFNGYLILVTAFREEGQLNLLEKTVLSYLLGVISIQLPAFLLAKFGIFRETTLLIILIMEMGIFGLLANRKRSFAPLVYMMRLSRLLNGNELKEFSSTVRKFILKKEFVMLVCATLISALYLFKCKYPVAVSTYGYIYHALELIENESFSETSYFWGKVRETVDNKPLLTAFTAAYIGVSDGNLFLNIQFLTLIINVLTILSAFCLLRTFFPINSAIFGCLILLSPVLFEPFFEAKATSFVGESFTYPFFFVGLWLNYHGVLKEKRDFFVVGQIINLFAVFTHGVVGSIMVLYVFCLFLSKIVLKSWNRYYDFNSVIISFILCVGPLLLFAVSNFERFDRKPIDPGIYLNDQYVESVKERNIDATYEFARLLRRKDESWIRYLKRGGFYTSPRDILETTVRRNSLGSWAVKISLIVSLIVLWFHRDRQILFTHLPFFLLAVSILLWAFAFSYLFNSYMPAEHVLRREIRYLRLFFVFVLCGGFSYFCQKLNSIRWSVIKRARNCDLFLYICFGIALICHSYILIIEYKAEHISQKVVHALAWLRQHTGEDDVILTNYRTTRFVMIFSGRKSIIEGPAKFSGDMLYDSLALIHGAQGVFNEPFSFESVEYIKRNNIQYIIWSKALFAGNRIVPKDYDGRKLKDVDYLQLVKEWDAGKPLYIFKVDHDALINLIEET